MSSPGVKPACSIASTSSLIASSLVARSGANPPSSPTAVDSPLVVQHLLERVVRLGAPAQRLGERRRADRHDHELLEVDRVVGVHAAVEDVHHRHRQHVGVRPADVAVQRQVELVGGGLGDRQARAEDRVGADPALVVGAVELDQLAVDRALVERVEPFEHAGDLAVDEADRGLARPCRRSARRRRGARPPRARRSTRRSARRPGRARRYRGTTSTSTVGLPRESRISRPATWTMSLIDGRTRVPAERTVDVSGVGALAQSTVVADGI